MVNSGEFIPISALIQGSEILDFNICYPDIWLYDGPDANHGAGI